MNRTTLFATVAAFALLSACTQTIQGPGQTPLQAAASILPQPIKDTTAKDLRQAATNFDNALKVGYTDLTDFDACQHLINQQLGVEMVSGSTAPPTAQVTNSGIVSGASILVIEADIARHIAAQGIQIPENCAMAFGELTLQNTASLLSLGKVSFTPALTSAQVQALIAPSAALSVTQ